MINGYTRLNVSKLDVLDGMEEIKICTDYLIDGKSIEFPADLEVLARVDCVYETLPGWTEPIGNCRDFTELPPNAQRYLARIEELVGVVEPKLLPRFALILQALYEEDALEEDHILAWYNASPDSSWLVNAKVATKVRQKAEPFITWLTTPDEDEEEEEE